MWYLGSSDIKRVILNDVNTTGSSDKHHLSTSALLSHAHTVPASPTPPTHNCNLPFPCVRGLDLGSALLTCSGDLEDTQKKTIKKKESKKEQSHLKSLQLDEPQHCFLPPLHSLRTGQRLRVRAGLARPCCEPEETAGRQR